LAAPAHDPVAKRIHSVGRAVSQCCVRVVDDHMRSLPSGEIGEIAAWGPITMQGYDRMPEMTAQTIIDGWVRTGDLGYMTEDGYLYLVDRKKDMIITGGENVYSSEVELALGRPPTVSDAGVIGVPDPHWGEAGLGMVAVGS